jgi:septum formation protein
MAKANSKEEARVMFGKLLGKTHEVVTGVAVVNSLTGEEHVGHETGTVTFREASAEELDEYVNKESNWRGFAGAYALQGGAAPFALNQAGKLSAIIGMPVELLVDLLEQAGVVVDAQAEEVEASLHNEHKGIGIHE